jgi:hypothetical protein
MDAFYYIANSRPLDIEKYEELLPRMYNITDRLRRIDDKVVKEQAILEYKAFKKSRPYCERIIELRGRLEYLKEQRNSIQNSLTDAQMELNTMRNLEMTLANKVSQDHMEANSKSLSLFELFPTVKYGYILTNLNEIYIENDSYENILNTIKYMPSPHICTFKRYDYMYELGPGTWIPLQRCRTLNMYVEDPLVRVRLD